ncbi:nucleoside 2-deoxyribosyltransferase [Rahnella sp. L72c]|uniref:Nucleoside 2-deoxyribosyltransferase n=1 Tax=Rahnella perminowiae TaxID=2816244 RepID=A0ABS6L799_9GAMM|nr:PfkB family carbohydrate kinase [Rahnella perminowiae]MBU9837330.1 nucleoside 2-deoxyribosyltransferase [Rahnella perminowiae]
MIHIIGGVYRERCLKPAWDDIYGSGGRAALAIAQMGTDVHLHAYIPERFLDSFNFKTSLIDSSIFEITPYPTTEEIEFNYNHGLDPIMPPRVRETSNIVVQEVNILVFGMLECGFKTTSEFAVYDPQNTLCTESFSKYGSTAVHLALVLNENEARVLNGSSNSECLHDVIKALHIKENAEVIVVKRGPEGATISYDNKFFNITAYETDTVWKIGSGDCFSAHFANNWIVNKNRPEEAAIKASIATSYFCNSATLPSPFLLDGYTPKPIKTHEKFKSNSKTVYIASPFFTLSQLWMVEQIRYNLQEMGVKVISPYHDIGLIESFSPTRLEQFNIASQDLSAITRSDIIFGIADGNDPGTIFEIGYAVSLGKKVVLLAENFPENDLTMFYHENIVITHDYVTAIYKTLWTEI